MRADALRPAGCAHVHVSLIILRGIMLLPFWSRPGRNIFQDSALGPIWAYFRPCFRRSPLRSCAWQTNILWNHTIRKALSASAVRWQEQSTLINAGMLKCCPGTCRKETNKWSWQCDTVTSFLLRLQCSSHNVTLLGPGKSVTLSDNFQDMGVPLSVSKRSH